MTPRADAEILLDRAAELMDRELGLRPDPSLRSRLQRSIRDEAAARGEDLAGYVGRLSSDVGVRQSLFDRLTVQETAFFRHPGQFQALAEHVLPHIDGPVTIWSAASSNGQEPYSLAMVLDEQAVPGSVIATDVSNRALQRTSEGSYRSQELTGLSPLRRERYLAAAPDGRWEIRKALRDRVRVQHHNLITDRLPDFVEHCQVVFCRNVLIYFSAEHAATFLTRLAQKLPPGACLFLGYAETIWQVTDLFEPVRIGDAFEYHRRRELPAARTVRRGEAWPGGAPRPPRAARPAGAAAKPERKRRVVEVVVPVAPSGKGEDAVGALRRLAYLEPDQPIAHLHLGLALEATGDLVSARRAFRAARAAVGRCDPASVAQDLGGYRVEELIRLLDGKEEGGRPVNLPS